jgi:hypothetical protein
MTTNQESIVANIQTALSLSGLNYNEAVRRLAINYGISESDTNSMLIQYLQTALGSTKTNINELLAEYSGAFFDGNVNAINDLTLGYPESLSGLLAWYDAADLSTITSSSGNVSAWADKSGNGNTASQGTMADQPTYNPTYNSNRGGITFGDSDEFLSVSTLQIPNNATVFIAFEEKTQLSTGSVFKCFLASQEAAMFDLLTDVDGYAFTLGRDGVDRYVAMTPVDGATSINTTFSTNARDVNVVFEYKKDGGDFEIFRDGGSLGSGSGGQVTDTPYTGYDIGNSLSAVGRSYRGTIMEIIIYSRALSDDERDSVRNYLNNKWGIA